MRFSRRAGGNLQPCEALSISPVRPSRPLARIRPDLTEVPRIQIGQSAPLVSTNRRARSDRQIPVEHPSPQARWLLSIARARGMPLKDATIFTYEYTIAPNNSISGLQRIPNAGLYARGGEIESLEDFI